MSPALVPQPPPGPQPPLGYCAPHLMIAADDDDAEATMWVRAVVMFEGTGYCADCVSFKYRRRLQQLEAEPI